MTSAEWNMINTNYYIMFIFLSFSPWNTAKNRSRSDAGCKQSPHYHINQPGGRTLPDLTLRCLQSQRVEQKQLCNQRLLVELTFNLTFKQCPDSGKLVYNQYNSMTAAHWFHRPRNSQIVWLLRQVVWTIVIVRGLPLVVMVIITAVKKEVRW